MKKLFSSDDDIKALKSAIAGIMLAYENQNFKIDKTVNKQDELIILDNVYIASEYLETLIEVWKKLKPQIKNLITNDEIREV